MTENKVISIEKVTKILEIVVAVWFEGFGRRSGVLSEEDIYKADRVEDDSDFEKEGCEKGDVGEEPVEHDRVTDIVATSDKADAMKENQTSIIPTVPPIGVKPTTIEMVQDPLVNQLRDLIQHSPAPFLPIDNSPRTLLSKYPQEYSRIAESFNSEITWMATELTNVSITTEIERTTLENIISNWWNGFLERGGVITYAEVLGSLDDSFLEGDDDDPGWDLKRSVSSETVDTSSTSTRSSAWGFNGRVSETLPEREIVPTTAQPVVPSAVPDKVSYPVVPFKPDLAEMLILAYIFPRLRAPNPSGNYRYEPVVRSKPIPSYFKGMEDKWE
ncbi:hypothetical protein HDU76_010755, partial [Blyttiomyces sp. JEL0837]